MPRCLRRFMKSFFKNCIDIKEEDGWYLPIRLSDAQIKSYSRREPLLLRAYGGAGIAIAFRTSAKHVEVEYKITSNVRDYAYWDILVDGVLVKTENLCKESDVVTLEIPGNGERTVEIYLPHLARVWFRKIKPDAEATPLAEKKNCWLFLGDSITQGMASQHPSLTYPVLAARQLGCDFINMGVCGAKFFAGDIDARHRTPDLITIAFGCNDWKQAEDEATFRESAREYIARVVEQYECKNICGILPIWRSDDDCVYGGMTFERMYEVLREEYGKYPYIHVIEGVKLMPHLVDFYGENNLLVHPNELGFIHYAMKLSSIPEIQKALKERGEN